MSLEPHFAFIVTGRNAIRWAPRCLESIRWQVGSFRTQLMYVNDASDYSQVELEALARQVESHGGTFLTNERRQWQVGSIARAIEWITDPYAIVCLLDADDYLLPHALRTVAGAYADPLVAMTYGDVLVDFRPFEDPRVDYFGPDKRLVNTSYPEDVWKTQAFRQDGFRCFHLRTFRRWLWDHIRPQDLCLPDGAPFRGSGDSAIIFPLLEMLSSPEHVRRIEEPIYVYRIHDQCVHVLDKPGQHDGFMTLRFEMPAYSALERAYLHQRLAQARKG